MARLKSRQQMPPLGFLFTQAETGWQAPQWLSFQDTVTNIIRHRKANPRFNLSTDIEHVEWELESFTVKRLQSMKSTQGFLVESDVAMPLNPPNFQVPPQPKSGVVVEASKKVAAGIGILLDWLGEGGKPVESELASNRAQVCSECPSNRAGKLSDFFTTAASEGIRKQLEIKNDLKLTTVYDDKLGVCGVCLCPLKLKVHAPIKHIKEHTKKSTIEELPENCWMLKEFTYE